MRLTDLDNIVRQVLPQVLPAPRSMVEDAIRYSAADFCDKSEVWLERIQEVVGYGEQIVSLVMPSWQRVASINHVWVGQDKLRPGEYELSMDEIWLKNPVASPALVTVEAFCKPSRYAEKLPDKIVEEYGDTIAYGAIARLKAMSGQGIEWTDTNGAAFALTKYNEGTAGARIDAIRARHGGDILAVGQEYI